MASRNDNNSGDAAALGFILAGLYFLAIVAAIIVAVMVLVFTVLSIMAWHKPLRVHKIIITPERAHLFVWSGLFGMCVFVFVLCLSQLFLGVQVNWNYLLLYLLGGYCLGAIGIEWILGEDEPEGPLVEYLPQPRKSEQAAPVPTPAPPPREPFRFASWDDEERSS